MKSIKNSIADNVQDLIPISKGLSYFIVIVALILGVIVSSIVYVGVGKIIEENQKEMVRNDVFGIIADFRAFIDTRSLVLQDYADLPILTQSVMQPIQFQSNIQDFMDELVLFNREYNLSLLDFEGKRIYSTKENPRFNYEKMMWIDSFGKNESLRHIELSEFQNQFYWRIAVGVVYNDNVEGILVAEIPLSEVDQFSNFSKQLTNIYLQLLKNDRLIATYGNQLETVPYEIRMEEYNVVFRYRMDKFDIAEARIKLLIPIISILTLFTIVLVAFSVLIAKKFFALPLERLSKSAASLADGTRIRPVTISNTISEIDDLADQFNSMSELVQRREEDLINSKKELEQTYSKLKENQAHLMQSEKMASLGLLAAGVAHEINNPTAFVMSNIEILQDYMQSFNKLLALYQGLVTIAGDENSEKMNIAIADIEELYQNEDLTFKLEEIDSILSESCEGTFRIKEIVQSFKSFARMDESQLEETNINECIETTLKIVWNEVKYKCILNKQLGEIPDIVCYPGKINQVILNLLVNAAQAIHDKGEITITTAEKDNNVIIKVSDTGKGISPENISNLFTPFFTTKVEGKGTGLGLYVSYGIINEHNGRIDVESTLGKGTVFTVSLPRNYNKLQDEI